MNCRPICLSFRVSYLSVCLSLFPCIHLPILLIRYLPTCLSIYLSIYPPSYLSVSLSISIYPSIYLPICLSVHLTNGLAFTPAPSHARNRVDAEKQRREVEQTEARFQRISQVSWALRVWNFRALGFGFREFAVRGFRVQDKRSFAQCPAQCSKKFRFASHIGAQQLPSYVPLRSWTLPWHS